MSTILALGVIAVIAFFVMKKYFPRTLSNLEAKGSAAARHALHEEEVLRAKGTAMALRTANQVLHAAIDEAEKIAAEVHESQDAVDARRSTRTVGKSDVGELGWFASCPLRRCRLIGRTLAVAGFTDYPRLKRISTCTLLSLKCGFDSHQGQQSRRLRTLCGADLKRGVSNTPILHTCFRKNIFF